MCPFVADVRLPRSSLPESSNQKKGSRGFAWSHGKSRARLSMASACVANGACVCMPIGIPPHGPIVSAPHFATMARPVSSTNGGTPSGHRFGFMRTPDHPSSCTRYVVYQAMHGLVDL